MCYSDTVHHGPFGKRVDVEHAGRLVDDAVQAFKEWRGARLLGLRQDFIRDKAVALMTTAANRYDEAGCRPSAMWARSTANIMERVR
jgi:hypothetical protein